MSLDLRLIYLLFIRNYFFFIFDVSLWITHINCPMCRVCFISLMLTGKIFHVKEMEIIVCFNRAAG